LHDCGHLNRPTLHGIAGIAPQRCNDATTTDAESCLEWLRRDLRIGSSHLLLLSAQMAGTLAVLGLFGRLAIPESVWEAAGRHQALLAVNGPTVPLADAIIATVALEPGLELRAYDLQSAAMSGLLPGLKLFQEPP